MAYVAYLCHLKGIFVVDTYMVTARKIKLAVCCSFLPVYGVMWGQHVDYIIRSHDEMLHFIAVILTKECNGAINDAIGVTNKKYPVIYLLLIYILVPFVYQVCD